MRKRMTATCERDTKPDLLPGGRSELAADGRRKRPRTASAGLFSGRPYLLIARGEVSLSMAKKRNVELRGTGPVHIHEKRMEYASPKPWKQQKWKKRDSPAVHGSNGEAGGRRGGSTKKINVKKPQKTDENQSTGQLQTLLGCGGSLGTAGRRREETRSHHRDPVLSPAIEQMGPGRPGYDAARGEDTTGCWTLGNEFSAERWGAEKKEPNGMPVKDQKKRGVKLG